MSKVDISAEAVRKAAEDMRLAGEMWPGCSDWADILETPHTTNVASANETIVRKFTAIFVLIVTMDREIDDQRTSFEFICRFFRNPGFSRRRFVHDLSLLPITVGAGVDVNVSKSDSH